ncbi:MAG: ABC transporter permease subunit [Clostridiales bacterium]|nr:ABC transporter permease subunit [Clostridiales bacterium]
MKHHNERIDFMNKNSKIALRKSRNASQKAYLKKSIRRNWDLYLLLLLPFAFLLVFNYYPMLGLQIAFKDYTASGGIWGSEFVGLDNFRKLFSIPKFTEVFLNTIRLSGYQILVEPAITLIFALLLNAIYSRSYRKTVQMISYMPHFISTVVMVGVLAQIFNTKIGLYGKVCDMIGVEAIDIWSEPKAFPHIYVWSLIWQNIGWNSIIYIAALASVDTDMYEAAEIDGANRFKQVLYIDLPSVLPTFVMLFILKIGSMMSIGYEQVLLMQNPLNLQSSEIISTYSYKVALVSGSDYSFGTAIGLFNSVINLVLIVMANKFSRRISDVSLW